MFLRAKDEKVVYSLDIFNKLITFVCKPQCLRDVAIELRGLKHISAVKVFFVA